MNGQPEKTANAGFDFLSSGGEMGSLMRSVDWSKKPLGRTTEWPQSLRSALSICLNSSFPIAIYWGRDLVLLYNDAWSPILGAKHPWALGRPAREAWSEIWDIIGPMFEQVIATGEATRRKDQLLPMRRHGYTEECYFDYTFSPIRGESSNVDGVFNAVIETTTRVIGERRLRTLRDLGAHATVAKDVSEACRFVMSTLAQNTADIPFALLYLTSGDGTKAELCQAIQLEEGTLASPRSIDLGGVDSGWPLAEAVQTGRTVQVSDLRARFGSLPGGPWNLHPEEAVVLPIREATKERLTGFLVAGASPCRACDEDYRGFFDLVAGQTAAAISNASAHEEQRKRAESLAELDRAKTAFFSNVSHEFRTPLTLMLGPAEDALAETTDPEQRERLEMLYRNTLRLQKLVNMLLDFSRIEAGRVQASYEPTDLTALTGELASVFRSAIEKAEMRLIVRCRPLGEPVYVDREMWEKIVLNLVSNAFKFTLEGEIEVSLARTEDGARLTVRDTGAGIPAEQLPHVFERFYRAQGAHARTHEGTGIGLALVQELVKLHSGRVDVRSECGRGTTFTVTIPFGQAHLPADRIGRPRETASTAVSLDAYVVEASRWLSADEADSPLIDNLDRPTPPTMAAGVTAQPRILIADDNADMRDYVRRLLAARYEVDAVGDGEAALAAAHTERRDLVITDVMMPRLDGFGLLKALRSDPETKTIPVIMLSARAGEDARIEGIQSGADDYLVKPFSARELVARVSAAIELARVRRELTAETAVATAKFRAVFDQSAVFAGIMTLEGIVLEANRLCLESCGFRREEVLGKLFWECGWWSGLEEVRAKIQAGTVLASQGVPYREVLPYVWADGTERVVDFALYPIRDETGRVVFLHPTGVDITERRLAEAALARSEALFRKMADANLIGVGFSDGQGNLAYVNDEMLRMMGYTRQDFEEGRVNLAASIAPEFAEADQRAAKRLLADGIVTGYEEAFLRPDGGRTPFIGAAALVEPESDLRVSIALDLTQVKRAQQERELLLEKLRDADHRKDEFLAMLAHELRNPLAAIGNAVSFAVRVEHGDHLTWAINIITRQLKHLTRLIDDLLDISRISRGKIELRRDILDVAPSLDAAMETVRRLIEERKHVLHTAINRGNLWADVDPTRLEQVIENLLTNAAKYSDNGGEIWLSASLEDNEVVIRVRDSGFGIPPERLPEMFELFAQGDRTLARSEGGLGIGLTVVKKLVEMHGGAITAKSEGPGKGSEFTVRLPAAKRAAAPSMEAKAGAEAVASESRRILVVDDNEDAALSIAMLLESCGHEVLTAFSGVEAIEVARLHQPDAILLDIGLPVMNGYEVASRLRAEGCCENALVVAISGYGQEEDRRRSRAAGFDHHLVKPIDIDVLIKLLAGSRSRTSAGPSATGKSRPVSVDGPGC
jgi:PAS domain S-box-containing protein